MREAVKWKNPKKQPRTSSINLVFVYPQDEPAYSNFAIGHILSYAMARLVEASPSYRPNMRK